MRKLFSLALVVCLSGALPMGTAQAAVRDMRSASTHSQWLVKQFRADGTFENPLGAQLPDHGLMIDAIFAMYASGDGHRTAKPLAYLEKHAGDYYTWGALVPDPPGFDAIIVGGAAAKLLVLAQVTGRDPRNFGGHNMVAETKGAIMRSGPDKGRVSDYSKDPALADVVSNDANVFGQALGVIGLAGAGENDQPAIDKLVTQQCSEGYFRIFFEYIPTNETGDHVTPNGYKVSTCDEGKPFDKAAPDGDATAMALSALLAARDSGVRGLDGPIAKTVAWLKSSQTPSGGWGGGVKTGIPNTNSTGLIVQALADAGGVDAARDVAVERGVAFLKLAQVNAADTGNKLAGHMGAIAYTPEAYHTARGKGIDKFDSWIRAGAQASLGLSQVGFYDLVKRRIPQDEPPARTDPPSATQPPVRGKDRVLRGKTVKVVVPGQAQPGSTTPAGKLGGYLAGMLVGGDHVEVTQDGQTFVDYDATADLVLALRTLGEQPEAVDRASRFLLRPESIQAYAHGVPYEKSAAYAEPLAKLRVIAGFLATEDIRPTIDQLRTDLAALRTGDGKFVDTGSTTDNSVRGHAWATVATIADSDRDGAAAAIKVLLEHRCADGTFPADLTTKDCATGDLAATAAAIHALNAQPPGDSDALPAERTGALVAAAKVLATKSDREGLLSGKEDKPDVVLSATVASGRQAAGLDAADTARSLGAMLLTDGGLPKDGVSDPVTSVAGAPGVAGKSWTSAANSPVTTAIRLPFENAVDGAPAPKAGSLPFWQIAALIGVGVLLALAFSFGLRRFIHRDTSNKGVVA